MTSLCTLSEDMIRLIIMKSIRASYGSYTLEDRDTTYAGPSTYIKHSSSQLGYDRTSDETKIRSPPPTNDVTYGEGEASLIRLFVFVARNL